MLTPPFGLILDFFEFQTLFYIAPRVPYGPQIWNLLFLKIPTPPPVWILDLFGFFLTPSPYFGKSPKLSRFLIMRSPLIILEKSLFLAKTEKNKNLLFINKISPPKKVR